MLGGSVLCFACRADDNGTKRRCSAVDCGGSTRTAMRDGAFCHSGPHRLVPARWVASVPLTRRCAPGRLSWRAATDPCGAEVCGLLFDAAVSPVWFWLGKRRGVRPALSAYCRVLPRNAPCIGRSLKLYQQNRRMLRDSREPPIDWFSSAPQARLRLHETSVASAALRCRDGCFRMRRRLRQQLRAAAAFA